MPCPPPVRAAYIHWPFCQHKCAYCDFVSWPAAPGEPAAYCELLLREIGAVTAWSRSRQLAAPLTSVYFGGGTPSLADPAALIRILEALRQTTGLAPAAEITLEANPGTVRLDQLTVLRQAGFNRLSLGLQAAQDALLRSLDRIHTTGDFITAVRTARAAGFERLSADLMLGLPGQTLADALASVELLLDLSIDHVSCYSLTLEPGTPFYERYAGRPDLLPDEDAEREMDHQVRARLTAAGILPYEISNLARPGQECRHNLVYWRGEPYYGFGVAAHSYLDGARRGNTPSLATYARAWSAWPAAAPAAAVAPDAAFPPGMQPVWPFPAMESCEIIDADEARRELFLLGLRLTRGVSWADYAARFGDDARQRFAPVWQRLQDRGLIEQDAAGVRLTSIGRDLGNQVFLEFVG